MKKLLILLLLLFTSCEEKKDGEISKFVGTWVVTEMGTYQVATCSGEVDDTEWRGLKGKGLTITLQIYKDGTGKEVITGPEPSTTILTWYDIGETFCFGGECYNYEMDINNKSFSVNTVEDAYCIDEDYAVTNHITEKTCQDASTGNQWFPPKCHRTRYKKQIN